MMLPDCHDHQRNRSVSAKGAPHSQSVLQRVSAGNIMRVQCCQTSNSLLTLLNSLSLSPCPPTTHDSALLFLWPFFLFLLLCLLRLTLARRNCYACVCVSETACLRGRRRGGWIGCRKGVACWVRQVKKSIKRHESRSQSLQ